MDTETKKTVLSSTIYKHGIRGGSESQNLESEKLKIFSDLNLKLRHLDTFLDLETVIENDKEIIQIFQSAHLLKNLNFDQNLGSKNLKKKLFKILSTVINLNQNGYKVNFIGLSNLAMTNETPQMLKIFKIDQIENTEKSEKKSTQNLNL